MLTFITLIGALIIAVLGVVPTIETEPDGVGITTVYARGRVEAIDVTLSGIRTPTVHRVAVRYDDAGRYQGFSAAQLGASLTLDHDRVGRITKMAWSLANPLGNVAATHSYTYRGNGLVKSGRPDETAGTRDNISAYSAFSARSTEPRYLATDPGAAAGLLVDLATCGQRRPRTPHDGQDRAEHGESAERPSQGRTPRAPSISGSTRGATRQMPSRRPTRTCHRL